MPGTRHWVIATRKHAPTRRTTIADVAREAGVNKGTVSRALRGISGRGPVDPGADHRDRGPARLLGVPPGQLTGQRALPDRGDRASDTAVVVLQRIRLGRQRDPDPGGLPGRADQPRHGLRRARRRPGPVPAAVPRARRRPGPRRAALRRHDLQRRPRRCRGDRSCPRHRDRFAPDQCSGHLRQPPRGRSADRETPAGPRPPAHRHLRRPDAGQARPDSLGAAVTRSAATCSGRPAS